MGLPGRWLWNNSEIVTCYPKGTAYGICRSTNGTLAKWRELVDGGYEIEWGYSNRPGIISIEVMYVVNDGTKLIGSNRKGVLLKALKTKLKTKPEFVTYEENNIKPLETDIPTEEDILEYETPDVAIVKDHSPKEFRRSYMIKPPKKIDENTIVEKDLPIEFLRWRESKPPIGNKTIEEFKLPPLVKPKSPEKDMILEGIKNQIKQMKPSE